MSNMIEYWKNEWASAADSGEATESPEPQGKGKILGGEVTNETSLKWLISGGSNSDEKDFALLPAHTNSDNFEQVRKQLKEDVDAVWPAGMDLVNGNTRESVKYGAFKLRDYRNTNIVEEDGLYVIYDFSVYFTEDNLPEGWKLPDAWDPRKY